MTQREGQVHIVDDDPAIRDSLAWLLRSNGLVVNGWESGEAFLAAHSPRMRGCVVLDVRMTGLSGLDVLDRLAALDSILPVIVLTGHGDVPIAVQSLKKGAIDFVEKPYDPVDFVERIVAALDREERIFAEADVNRGIRSRLDALSTRETEVLELMLAGRMNKQIAEEIGVTMRTVEVHRARILEKFGVRSAVELARLLARLR